MQSHIHGVGAFHRRHGATLDQHEPVLPSEDQTLDDIFRHLLVLRKKMDFRSTMLFWDGTPRSSTQSVISLLRGISAVRTKSITGSRQNSSSHYDQTHVESATATHELKLWLLTASCVV